MRLHGPECLFLKQRMMEYGEKSMQIVENSLGLESSLRLNRYVVLQKEWNEKHIQERANELAKKAESI